MGILASIRKNAAAAAVSALAWVGVALPAVAEPAMWVVKDQDSTIYLLGTIHTLPEGVNWRTPKIDKALGDSSELYLEIADVTSIVAQVVAAVTMLRYGMSPSKPLSSRLDKKQWASLEKAAKAAGFTAQSLNGMRPWFAAMLIQTGQMVQSGEGQDPGVDMQLQKQFGQARKPVKGLESIARQVKVFADLPEKDEMAFLLDTLKDADPTSGSFDDLVGVWKAGDTAKLEKSVIGDIKRSSPVLYHDLIVGRNEDWVNQIQAMLKGSGTTFIAVGAGHLVGPDSVPAQLKAKGLDVARY